MLPMGLWWLRYCIIHILVQINRWTERQTERDCVVETLRMVEYSGVVTYKINEIHTRQHEINT